MMRKINNSLSANLIVLAIIIIFNSCVEPPEYEDGLLENIPAIINENDYFSFTINAKDHVIISSLTSDYFKEAESAALKFLNNQLGLVTTKIESIEN